MNNLFSESRVYSVEEINTAVREAIKREFSGYVWVYGEIQDMRQDRNKGHIYFSLVQKDSRSSKIAAKVSMSIWKSREPLIVKRIREVDGAFELKNDIEAKFLCEVGLYVPWGKYSLSVVDLDPVYTLGKVAQNRLKIIEELKRRGVIDKNKQQDMPSVPLRIGLITAFDSAAYHDFIHELEISRFAFTVTAWNAYMQGDKVEKSVLDGLKYFNGLTEKPDIVVITRGGGSKADLSWFDNKKIAEHIAGSNFVVFTALGHQIDESIADIVAYQSFKTPTKVAQHLCSTIEDFLADIENTVNQIVDRSSSIVNERQAQLKMTGLEVSSSIKQYLSSAKGNLVESKTVLVSSVKQLFKDNKRRLRDNITAIRIKAGDVLQVSKRDLEDIKKQIVLLDPKTILERGYTMSFKNGRSVKSSADLTRGDLITTVFSQGQAVSEVRELK